MSEFHSLIWFLRIPASEVCRAAAAAAPAAAPATGRVSCLQTALSLPRARNRGLLMLQRSGAPCQKAQSATSRTCARGPDIQAAPDRHHAGRQTRLCQHADRKPACKDLTGSEEQVAYRLATQTLLRKPSASLQHRDGQPAAAHSRGVPSRGMRRCCRIDRRWISPAFSTCLAATASHTG